MSTRSFTELPSRAASSGFIYVIAFSNSETTVKVGLTSDPRSRFAQHRAAGEPFGVDIADWWLSPAHLDYAGSERSLIRAVEGLGARKLRNEYFTGVTFGQVVELAESLGITEAAPGESDLVASLQRADSQRRQSQHDEEQRLNAQVGMRHTAERYGMTGDQVAGVVASQPDGEVAQFYNNMVEAARLSRQAWHRSTPGRAA